jgi:hypothetical protein
MTPTRRAFLSFLAAAPVAAIAAWRGPKFFNVTITKIGGDVARITERKSNDRSQAR